MAPVVWGMNQSPQQARMLKLTLKEISMEKIEWNDDLVINIKEMDDPKKDLVEYLNRFVDVVKEGKISKELIDSLADMIDRMRFLFKREELLLARYKYPEMDFHQEKHKRLIKRIIKFRRWIADDPEDLSDANLDNFMESIENHLSLEDQEYAPYIRLNLFLASVGKR